MFICALLFLFLDSTLFRSLYALGRFRSSFSQSLCFVFSVLPSVFSWGSFIQILAEFFFFHRPRSQAGNFSRYWPFHAKMLQLFPAPSFTRPSFLLCHAAMCLCIPHQLDKRRQRSYSLLPLTFTSCFYNLSKAHCLHSGTGFVLKELDNGMHHNVIS